ncbi:MAG: SurA N-terminal domain-containing protein [Sideroxydans sp.]|nr:SurA N-terminal domain-containing protein [Sideroxydans sp.]
MFDFVQEKKYIVYIVLGLITASFGLVGVNSYQKSSSVDAPATVNGTKISAQELERSVRQQQEQLKQRLGQNFDAAMFDTSEMKRAVLENLVAQRVLIDAANQSGLTVSDAQIAQVIGSVEAFQDNGVFDKKRYAKVLANNNLLPLMYEKRVRDELVSQQLNEIFMPNAYSSAYSIAKVMRLNEQQRVVSVATIPALSLMTQVQVDTAAIKQYYDLNQKEFAIPEQARVEFVKFSVANLVASSNVESAEVAAYYKEHQAEFSSEEQRQAAHILISVAATAPQAEQDAAKAKAEQVLAQVNAAPTKFAELAKQFSQDPGSAPRGGDLGFFSAGMMVKPFSDAAFALKAGEVSGLVKSDFGYHIIKLTAVKASRVLPFDEARETIANKLRQQKASEKFAELAEKFSNTVYEQSDSLQAAAQLAGAKIEQSDWLIKGMPNVQPFNAKALQAIFSEDVVKNKRNTAAIEIDASTLVAARIKEYKAASVKPLAEVQAAIEQKLAREKAIALATTQGAEALAKLQKDGSTHLTFAAAQTVTRQANTLDADVTRLVFQANGAKLPQFVGHETAAGYTIVRVEAVKNVENSDVTKQQRYDQQVRQLLGEELFKAYIADAKKQASISINLPDVKSVKAE